VADKKKRKQQGKLPYKTGSPQEQQDEAQRIEAAREAAQAGSVIQEEEAELAEAQALIGELEAALIRCEEALAAEEICARKIDGAGNKGVLAGGNVVHIVGDFVGTDPIVAVGGGQSMFYALSATGVVWVWGDNVGSYSLGTGGDSYLPWPTPLQIPEPVREVVVSPFAQHSLAIGVSGTVYSWGHGSYTFLQENWPQPTNIMFLLNNYLLPGEEVIHAYVTLDGTLLLTSTGRVLFQGYMAGIMDDCSELYADEPVDITHILPLAGGEKVTSLIVGAHQFFALTDAHHVYAWGKNNCGQTGLGQAAGDPVCLPTSLTGHIPLAADEYIIGGNADSDESTTLLTNQGNLYYMGCSYFDMLSNGNEYPNPTLVSGGTTLASNGALLMLVVTDGGTRLWVMGDNNVGGMGNGSVSALDHLTDITYFLGLHAGETIIAVATTDGLQLHSQTAIILTSEGRVFTFGYGSEGLLGNGTYADNWIDQIVSTVPVDITSNFYGRGAYVSCLEFGDEPALYYEVLNDNVIMAIVPPGAAYGYVDIRICGNAPQVIARGYEYVDEICIR
jgi:alpha-tubulin suppressor-like RCC1 family protein